MNHTLFGALVPPSKVHLTDWQSEQSRRQSNKQKILARLQQGNADGNMLEAVGGRRFSARLLELKRDGWDIMRVQVSPSRHVYSLIGRIEVQEKL